MRAIISRFAPAPTGFLHIGHVVNAIFVWGVTRLHRGRVLLRIEDHDRQRSRLEYERAIFEDLAWLGFAADDAPVRQSERGDIYERALGRLREEGRVYACSCSRSDVARPCEGRDRGAAASAPEALRRASPELADFAGERRRESPALQSPELRYPGTCRSRGLTEGAGVGLRVRLEPSVERFVDLRYGPQEQRPQEQCGDLLVRDRDGNWSYQFAATVDDFVQSVTLVIRGDDLLDSTGRQMQLARLLGRPEPPRFLHHGLIMKSPTQKLSKSDRDTGVRDLRAKGWTAPQVVGQAAFLAGLLPAPRDVHAAEVSSMMSAFSEVDL